MKVLIRTNERYKKRFLLTLGKSVTKDEVRKIIDMNDDIAMRRLIARSAEMKEVSTGQASHAYSTADFIVIQNKYSLERLA